MVQVQVHFKAGYFWKMAYLPTWMLVLESLPTVIGTAAVAPALLVLWLVVAADEPEHQ